MPRCVQHGLFKKTGKKGEWVKSGFYYKRSSHTISFIFNILIWISSSKTQRRRYGAKKSRYRIVQYAYDVTAWCRRLVVALWNAVTGGGASDLQELMRGIRINIEESKLQEWSARIGASMAALITCYCVGVLFAVAPMVLGLLAITTGVLFPSWLSGAFEQLTSLVEETRARGRGEQEVTPSSSRSSRRSLLSGGKLKKGDGKFDKNRYHFFVRDDGTKKWYRTGQPLSWFDRSPTEPEKNWFIDFWTGYDSNDKKQKKAKTKNQKKK